MVRLFSQHKVRQQIELEGLWEFTPISGGEALPGEFGYSMPVPGCWEMHPDFLTYRGKGAYRKVITLEEQNNVRFTFKGVSHTADVYFDGKHVGHHYNAFTEFSIVIPSVKAGEHELIILADNTFSEASALHVPNDYYTYGGIIRPVVMEVIPEVYIERLEFVPLQEGSSWKAGIKVYIRNISAEKREVSIKGKLGVNQLDIGSAVIEANSEAVISKEFAFNDVKPWSSESPTLYLLQAQLLLSFIR